VAPVARCLRGAWIFQQGVGWNLTALKIAIVGACRSVRPGRFTGIAGLAILHPQRNPLSLFLPKEEPAALRNSGKTESGRYNSTPPPAGAITVSTI
jgi:hypothetical protein